MDFEREEHLKCVIKYTNIYTFSLLGIYMLEYVLKKPNIFAIFRI